MWIRVALDNSAIQGKKNVYRWISGNAEEFYFGEDVAAALERDGFLTEMWEKLDAVFDWGDCDFFIPEKCIAFKEWLIIRLQQKTDPIIRPVYETMLDYADKAITRGTGIEFDF